MPSRPSAPISLTSSRGKCAASYQPAMFGRIRSSTNARTRSRSASSSAEKQAVEVEVVEGQPEGSARERSTVSRSVMWVILLRQAASSRTAMPCPTPMHMVVRARRAPRSCSSSAAVSASRAPLAPSGWPSAIAAAVRVDVLGVVGQPEQPQHGQRLRRRTPRSARRRRRRRSSARSGRAACGWPGTGPMPITRGGTPATAPPLIRASGSSP